MSALRTVIVGTAGHIDHGKSTLVRVLTGVDPDRLAEERERGMTIDLGFAPYRHGSGALVGMIDVPGHERFLRNMVAGATSVDVALLVVAADDGVMPQTREHLAILGLLGVRRGLVALTKADLVDEDVLELARLDVAALLEGSELAGWQVLPVSGTSGRGIPELREALDALVDAVPPRAEEGPFRMPVQRVFSAPGHGTVVTGVPVSGRAAAGDELEVVGRGLRLRVRGVQAYGEAREAGRAGHSTALNVSGASREEVRRGDVIAAPGAFAARRHLAAHYRHLAEAPLRNRAAVLLHTGTSAVPGEAVVLHADAVGTGEEGYLQLRLAEPVACAAGDRFLLRHAASLVLLGGGTLIAGGDGRLKRFKERVLREAHARREAAGDPVRLARVVLAAAGRRGVDEADLALEAGLPPDRLRERLAPLRASGELLLAGERLWLDPGAVDELAEELVGALEREHGNRPLQEWIDVAALRARAEAPEEVVRLALDRDDRIETGAGGRVRRRGRSGRLSGPVEAARERILAALARGGAVPPPVDPALAGLGAAETAALVARLRASGEIVAVGPFLFDAATILRLGERLVEHGRARQGAIDIPALRDELGTTRKYLIPLLEHFDAAGITVRHGDRRSLRRVERAT